LGKSIIDDGSERDAEPWEGQRVAAPPNPLTCLPFKAGRIAAPSVSTTAMLAVTASSRFLVKVL
jgi:hypothetical protein